MTRAKPEIRNVSDGADQAPPRADMVATGERDFVRRVLLTIALVALALAVWKISDILLLAFAAVLVALGLDSLAARVRPLTGGRHGLAVGLAALSVVAVIILVVWVFGAQISSQLEEVSQRALEAVRALAAEGEVNSIKPLLQGSTIGDLVANAISWGTTLFGIATSVVLLLAAGIYLALEPDRYRKGLLALVPREASALAAASLDETAIALRRWFGGQLIAMVLVGGLTAAGLWAIGVPAYLGLGLIAGLVEFIPVLGPIAGAVPALLVASTQDWTTVAWVLVLFVAIQQIENNVIMPLLTGRAVQMPAALGIFATLAMGVLFGPLGLLFGYPLAIVVVVMVRQLYVREVLEKDVTLPSESAAAGERPD